MARATTPSVPILTQKNAKISLMSPIVKKKYFLIVFFLVFVNLVYLPPCIGDDSKYDFNFPPDEKTLKEDEKFKSLAKKSPQDWKIFYDWGNTLIEAGRKNSSPEMVKFLRDGIEKLQTASKINPNSDEIFHKLGDALFIYGWENCSSFGSKFLLDSYFNYLKSAKINPTRFKPLPNWGQLNISDEDRTWLYIEWKSRGLPNVIARDTNQTEPIEEKNWATQLTGETKELLSMANSLSEKGNNVSGIESDWYFTKAIEKLDQLEKLCPGEFHLLFTKAKFFSGYAQKKSGKEADFLFQLSYENFKNATRKNPGSKIFFNEWTYALLAYSGQKEGSVKQLIWEEVRQKGCISDEYYLGLIPDFSNLPESKYFKNGIRSNEIKNQNIILFQGLSIFQFQNILKINKLCSFPLPSIKELTLYRPKISLGKIEAEESNINDEDRYLNCNISTVFEDSKKIWVGFSFYDGEGCHGLGGVGFYDKSTGRVGILRHPALSDYSISELKIVGNKLYAKTLGNYELCSTYGNGLIMVDFSNLEVISKVPSGTSILWDKDDPISNTSYLRPIQSLIDDPYLLEKKIPDWDKKKKEEIKKSGLENYMLKSAEKKR